MKQPHRAYLARQAVELLTLLKALGSEPPAYVFPSILRSSVPLGEATLNHFFKRLASAKPLPQSPKLTAPERGDTDRKGLDQHFVM